MEDDEFAWYDPKAEINAKSHGITFEEARRVFEDRNAKWFDDTDSSWAEDRYRITGQVGGRVLFLSYTYQGNQIRLISARRATKRETNDYYRS